LHGRFAYADTVSYISYKNLCYCFTVAFSAIIWVSARLFGL